MILGAARGWIGVDVGTRAVKLAQVSRRGSRMFLEDAVVLPRVPTLPPGVPALDLPACGELQAARTLGRRFAGTTAAATMPQPCCQLHSLHVNASGDAGHRAVIGELQRITQETEADFSPESWQVDFWRLDQVGMDLRDGPNVCALAVPRMSSDKLSRDIQDAGLQCQLLDGEPLALARAAHLCCPQDQSVAAIDWGYSHTLLTVAVKGCPIYTRSLPDCAFSDIVDAVTQSHGLLPEEAESLLSSVGLPMQAPPHNHHQNANDDLARGLLRAITEQLVQFLEELERTMSFLQSHRRGWCPSTICLMGAGATVPGMPELLSVETSRQVQAWTFPGTIHSSQPDIELALLGSAIAVSALAWNK